MSLPAADPRRVADPTAAIAAYLKAAVGTLLAPIPPGLDLDTGTPAVFRPELPKAFMPAMPCACLVVRRAGGYKMFGSGQLPVADPTIDILCWAAVRLQADRIADAVAVSLKRLSMEIWEGTLVHWAAIAGGPIPLPDQHTLWPGTLVSAQVMHAEMTTT